VNRRWGAERRRFVRTFGPNKQSMGSECEKKKLPDQKRRVSAGKLRKQMCTRSRVLLTGKGKNYNTSVRGGLLKGEENGCRGAEELQQLFY